MKFLMKHPTLGNVYAEEEEVTKMQAEGWVRWPRTAEEKAGAACGNTGLDYPAGSQGLNSASTEVKKRKYTRRS